MDDFEKAVRSRSRVGRINEERERERERFQSLTRHTRTLEGASLHLSFSLSFLSRKLMRESSNFEWQVKRRDLGRAETNVRARCSLFKLGSRVIAIISAENLFPFPLPLFNPAAESDPDRCSSISFPVSHLSRSEGPRELRKKKKSIARVKCVSTQCFLF